MKMNIWVTPFTLEEVNRRCVNSLSDNLGIQFTELGKDFLTACMPIDKRTLQPMGILHGGASAALAETVGSAAANYCLDQNLYVAVGLDLNINHIRPAKSGLIKAVARPFHLGKTTQVWEIHLMNEEGKLIAISRLTMAVISKESLRLNSGGLAKD
jgi:1,4-dihydroxy-2-naphthoyl-CoA hydrolase